MVSLSELKGRAARARIAAALALSPECAELGSIRLTPRQQLSVARVREHIASHGGCLLADDVGQGKTFVALAIARGWSRPLIVIPASLRSTWREAMRRAECDHPTITHDALSRGRRPEFAPDGIVVDESHHFRTPSTRRYGALAEIGSHSRFLLLSATPMQNASRDLAAQTALFLGSRTFHLAGPMLARHVVRGMPDADETLPTVASPRWIRPAADDSRVLAAILELSSPPLPIDGGDARVLRTLSLVRAWASSRAALRASLSRRRRIATAIAQCVECGRHPTARDLHAWQSDDDGAVQLGFVEMLVDHRVGDDDIRLLREQVADECAGIARIEHAMRRLEKVDHARVESLRAIRWTHPGTRVLAFSEHAATVGAYFALMRADAAVGMLTAREGRIASGRIPRDQLLARFAPQAQGMAPPPERERVNLLLTTDLLSEGVNLQDAGVVVHLDLPWNPARLLQRVGRLRRPGGATIVHSYLVAPPADTELLLRVEERLREKVDRATMTIGEGFPVIPALTEPPPSRSTASGEVVGSAASQATLLAMLAPSHRSVSSKRKWTGHPVIAAVQGTTRGWLATFADGRLLGAIDGAPPNELASPIRLARLTDGTARMVSARERDAALYALHAQLASARVAQECGLDVTSSPVHVAVQRAIALVLIRMPRHDRARSLPVAVRLRARMASRLTIGAERHLARTLSELRDDTGATWLRETMDYLERGSIARGADSRQASLVALILIGP